MGGSKDLPIFLYDDILSLMKIVYACAYSDIKTGGGSRVPWELARQAAKDTRNEVWMICTDSEYSLKKDSLEPKLLVQTVPSAGSSDNSKFFSPTPYNTLRVYEILNQIKPDIIHSHNFDPMSFIIQSWALSRGIPFIYTGHILPSQHMYGLQNAKLTKAIEKFININFNEYAKVFYNNCSKIICLNEPTKIDFAKFLKQDTNLVVISNGFSVPQQASKTPSLNNSNEINLIFPGWITKSKNQQYLIEMLKYLKTVKNVSLYLPGNLDEGPYKRQLENMIKLLPDDRKCFLMGYIDHTKLLGMYLKCHYFVSASLIEVQSLAVIESLASGTPVIALENATTQDLIVKNINGEVLGLNASPREFADILDKYISLSDREYLKLRDNSKKSVKQLAYPNVMKQHLELYYSLEKGKKKLLKVNGSEILKNMSRLFKWEKNPEKKKKAIIYHRIAMLIIPPLAIAGAGIIKASTRIKERKLIPPV